jgi:GT2 family glycosyltransferase
MDVGAVAGSMFMVRTKDFLNVGGFDEKIFLYCEETVLGIKMRQAQKRVVLYEGKFTHYHSVTISKSIKKFKDREKMQWSSRKYVLRNYFNFNGCKMLIVNLVEKMTILTRSLIHAIRV